MRQNIVALAAAVVMLGVAFAPQAAWAGTAFTYQGELSQLGAVVNGPADFQCSLWDALNDGAQIGSTVEAASVTVQNGVFTLSLDFGITPFSSEGRWLQIAVRAPAGGGSFTTLAPRQELTPAPYALKTRGIYVDDLDNITMSLSQAQGTATMQSLGGIELVIDADTNNAGGEDQNARMVLKQDGGLVVGRVGFRNNENTLEIMQEFDDDLVFGTNDADVLTISNDGNVGIGATGPTAKLQVLVGDAEQPLNVTTFGNGPGSRLTAANFSNPNPALTISTTGTGPALALSGANNASPALRIDEGYLKVPGAGLGASTFVFIHTSTAGNIDGSGTEINHPLTNDSPSAILFVTVNATQLSGTGGSTTTHPVGVLYHSDTDRWSIFNQGNANMAANVNFNVMVIKP